MSRQRRVRLAAAVLLAALAVLAVWAREPLVREGLWRDEALSVFIAAAPSVPELLQRNRVADYTPPLFNALLAGYMRLVGTGEIPLKRLALALGILAAAAGTALAWELGGPVAAVLAAVLLVHNPILLDMSTELRAYSLSAFLACAALLAAFRIRRRAGRGVVPYALLAVLLALLVYSHLAGAVIAAVVFVWGLSEWRRAPESGFGRGLAGAALAAGIAFLPWLPTTWRQFRTGLPWETPLPPTQSIAALLGRAPLLVPVPQGAGAPLVLVALGALALLALVEAPRMRERLGRAKAGLIVPFAAGAAVWVGLGLYSRQHPRYLTIPAALFSVGLAVLAAGLFEVGRAGKPWLRATAWVAVAALALSAFDARSAFYRWRVSAAPVSKSGIRDLCLANKPEAGVLVVAAPDYFAPTIWYYCGASVDLHGFARWEDPTLFDPRGYGELWADPAAVERTLESVRGALAASRRRRFVLVSDPAPFVPAFAARVGELRAALDRSYDTTPIGRFRGRLESVEAAVLSDRGVR